MSLLSCVFIQNIDLMGIYVLRFTNIAANIFGYKMWCIVLLLENHFPHCSQANCLKKMVLARAQQRVLTPSVKHLGADSNFCTLIAIEKRA